MENRSFDHYFGHLATDQAYLDAGRRAYGKEFAVNGTIDTHFRDVPIDEARLMIGGNAARLYNL